MSSNVTENDTWHETVPAPDVGDTTYPAVVADAIDRVADRTRHDHNSLTGNATFDALDVASATEQLATQFIIPTTRLGPNNLFTVNTTRLVQSFKWMKERLIGLKTGNHQVWQPPVFLQNDTNNHWRGFSSGNPPSHYVVQTNANADAVLFIPLTVLPRAGIITTVTVRLKGQGHGAAPANMPLIALDRYANALGVPTAVQVASATDATAHPAYDAIHTVQLTGLSENLQAKLDGTNAFWYAVRIRGEHGANAVPDGLQVYGVDITIFGAT